MVESLTHRSGSVQRQLAVVRVVIDALERSIVEADLVLETALSAQLADELEVLAWQIRSQPSHEGREA